MSDVNETPSDEPQNSTDPQREDARSTDAGRAGPQEQGEDRRPTAPGQAQSADEAQPDEDAPLPAEFFTITGERSRAAAVDAARRELARHEVVVMPTDTVYGIAANAFSARGVERLLEAKGRDRTMPPPVLIAHAGVLEGLADEVSEEARALAQAFWPGGLTLICHAQPSLQWDLGETRGTVALRVPDDAVAQALLQETGPLAVSSANRTGMPAAVTAEQAREMLGDSVRVYLEDGPRTEGMDPAPSGAAPAPVSSTIVDCTGGTPVVVRHGRISLTRLREIVPSVIGDGGSGAAPGTAEAGGAPAQEPTQPPEDEQAAAEGASSGGSTVADPEIGIVEQARAEQERSEDREAGFTGARTAGASTAAAVVAAGGRRAASSSRGAPDQDRTRTSAPSSEETRPLGVAEASALVAFSAPGDDAPTGQLRDTGVDQQR